jgi:hypothetical protein
VRAGRVLPFVLLHSGMLPFQSAAWLGGVIRGRQTPPQEAADRLSSAAEGEGEGEDWAMRWWWWCPLRERFHFKWDW